MANTQLNFMVQKVSLKQKLKNNFILAFENFNISNIYFKMRFIHYMQTIHYI